MINIYKDSLWRKQQYDPITDLTDSIILLRYCCSEQEVDIIQITLLSLYQRHFTSTWVHHRTFGGVRVAHLVVFVCVVLLCVFTFWVPCCGVRYDFALKRCSIRLCLHLFVGGLMSYLYIICVCLRIVVSNIYCAGFYVAGLSGLPIFECPLGIL
jgi:hypothetical protein